MDGKITKSFYEYKCNNYKFSVFSKKNLNVSSTISKEKETINNGNYTYIIDILHCNKEKFNYILDNHKANSLHKRILKRTTIHYLNLIDFMGINEFILCYSGDLNKFPSKLPQNLETIFLKDMNLKGTLNVSEFSELNELNCNYNSLKKIKYLVPTVRFLMCCLNKISKLNLNKHKYIINLYINNNNLKHLKINNNIRNCWLYDNKITYKYKKLLHFSRTNLYYVLNNDDFFEDIYSISKNQMIYFKIYN